MKFLSGNLAILSLVVLLPLAFMLPWQVALFQILIALTVVQLKFGKGLNSRLFFWLFAVDAVFLAYSGLMNAYPRPFDSVSPRLAILALVVLSLAAVSTRVEIMLGKASDDGLPGMLKIAAFIIAVTAALYARYMGPYVFGVESGQPLLPFVGIATDWGMTLMPPVLSGEFDSLPFDAVSLGMLGILLVVFGLLPKVKNVASTPQARAILMGWMLLLAIIGIFRFGSLASDFVNWQTPDKRASCYPEQAEEKIDPPPASLVDKLHNLKLYRYLKPTLDARARHSWQEGKPFQAAADYAFMLEIDPANEHVPLRMAAALVEDGLRKTGMDLAKNLVYDKEALESFKPCQLAEYSFIADLWIWLGSEFDQRKSLEPLSPEKGEVYSVDLESKLHDLTMRYASHCIRTDKPGEARRIAELVLQKDPNDVQALNVLGELAYSRQEVYKAWEYFDRVHDLSKPNYLYRFNLLSALTMVGERGGVRELQDMLRQEFPRERWEGPQGWNLAEAGYAETQLILLPGWHQFGVMASGSPAKKEFPIMSIYVNGKHVRDFKIEDGQAFPYTCEFFAERGLNTFKIVYENDYRDEKEDRKLLLGQGMARPVFRELDWRW